MVGHELVSSLGIEMQPEKVGVMALGSYEEKHGAALPPNTDIRLASHVAREAAKRSGAKFIGALYSSYELPDIRTGVHHSMKSLLSELTTALASAKRLLSIEGAVLVNGHGGNKPVGEKLPELEEKLKLRLAFNDTLTKIEGPHATTGELSMGMVLGITDLSKLAEHTDFTKHPEVGFVGLSEVRRRYPWAEKQAQEVMRLGIRADRYLGEKLFECAIADVMNTILEL
jgi:2-amino-5-formylamino-6-ribosylaminopyrimidin-4(3H)-one 5'-monophosphate deformylase